MGKEGVRDLTPEAKALAEQARAELARQMAMDDESDDPVDHPGVDGDKPWTGEDGG